MELWLLGAGVIVLIAITLLLVWRAPSAEMVGASVRNEEDTRMMPQGDEFEDQYTSATADLSACGEACVRRAGSSGSRSRALLTPLARRPALPQLTERAKGVPHGGAQRFCALAIGGFDLHQALELAHAPEFPPPLFDQSPRISLA